MNAIQVQIHENVRILAKLKYIWAGEKKEEDRIKSLPTHTIISTIQVFEDLKTFSTHHTLVHLMDSSMVMLIPQP